MEYVTAVFSLNDEDILEQGNIKKNSKLHKSLLKNINFFDVNYYLFVPKVGDFWDKETLMLIPNYTKRKRSISLKTHDELIDWYYFIGVDNIGNVVSVINFANPENEDTKYVVSAFRQNPKVRIK